MGEEFSGEAVKQLLSLEDYERFTQLCAVTNLVKLGPKNGLFTRFVEVDECVLRVYKSWLRKLSECADEDVMENIVAGNANKDKEPVEDVENTQVLSDLSDEGILWMNQAKTTGLRLKVRERKFRRDAPILIRADEDEDTPVTFEIEYHELLIQTSHLLLCLEKSFLQDDSNTGKAVVFGTFG
jgi:hypothetical protein